MQKTRHGVRFWMEYLDDNDYTNGCSCRYCDKAMRKRDASDLNPLERLYYQQDGKPARAEVVCQECLRALGKLI